jgi:hypothetical protein
MNVVTKKKRGFPTAPSAAAGDFAPRPEGHSIFRYTIAPGPAPGPYYVVPCMALSSVIKSRKDSTSERN